MNLAQLIDYDRVIAMTAERPEKPAAAVRIVKTKTDRILELLREKTMTLSELHDAIGGSKGSLSVYLTHMHKAGVLSLSAHRYSLA